MSDILTEPELVVLILAAVRNRSNAASRRANLRHPDHNEPAAVLGPVKVWPGKPCIRVEGGAAANLDSPCARRPPPKVGRGEGTGFKSNKGTGFREGTPFGNSSPLHIDAAEQTHFLTAVYISKSINGVMGTKAAGRLGGRRGTLLSNVFAPTCAPREHRVR